MQRSYSRIRITDKQKPVISQDQLVLILSIAVQLVLAVFFGHFYDMRIYMATGYLIGTGQNPYVAQDLTAVFNNSIFQGMTTVGYPPPWPLVLGLLFRSVYPVFPNLFVYNLAIKIPIILANIGLAYLVANILKNLGAEAAAIRRAWIFMLLNPFILYFGTAWGQFDSIVALLALLSLVLLHNGKANLSAISLALSISLKPIAIPILPVVLIYLMGKSLRQAFVYSIEFFASVILFCVVPFILFGWDPTPILKGWNFHFTIGGGMSFLTFFELLKDTYQLPGLWWLLGLIFIPALGIGIYALRHGIDGFTDLLKKSTGMIMIFFLTRTWLSEPNITLILPFVLILASIGELEPLAFAAVWILPLIFTFFNTSPPQLLFLSFPESMVNLLKLSDHFRALRLVARTLIVIPWQIVGWWIVFTCFKRNPSPSQSVLVSKVMENARPRSGNLPQGSSDAVSIKSKGQTSDVSLSVEITFPESAGISLKIGTNPSPGSGYPTAPMQKGLRLLHDGKDLSEEGLGFGVPLLKRGIHIIYPGSIELASQQNSHLQQVTATFTMDLEEKVTLPGFESARFNVLYTVKYLLAALLRRFPSLRGLLTITSNTSRRMFGWKTVFEKGGFSTKVKMVYIIDRQAGTINIESDLANLTEHGITEVFVLNEQGARHFDLYRDSSGASLRGTAIGIWDQVTAEQASFLSDSCRVAFTLQQVKGATLYRGRELIGSRLAWSGFGYAFPPTIGRFDYQVRIEVL